MPIVVATELDKRYRRTWALRRVGFELADGGVTALVGPNGAGKSTLLKLCIGFERPTGGHLTVAGVDPQRNRGGAVAAIGYVPQTPILYRELSVLDHLDLAGALRPGFDRAHARGRLSDLGIRLESTPGQLSGGQAAQVWLAVALGTRAPLLLLDEPLANLDPLARREFLQVVVEAAASGDVTVLLSSHVITDVEPVAQRLLLLADGRILIHDAIGSVLAVHRAHRPDAVGSSGELVSRFPDRNGETLQLRRTAADAPGAAATLEEVVLGYLASARTTGYAA